MKINWKNDDGVFLPMINDVVRNRFYESIIEKEVNDRHCIDIGFGTGMLSLIALKHGAEMITAYEMNTDRFQLGKEIIQSLNLSEKITLVNEKFNYQTPVDKECILISETVGTNLWSEGMFNTMPHEQGYSFLPGKYFLELFVIPVSSNYLDVLTTPASMHSFFAPGIDINPDFINLINQYIESQHTVSTHTRLGIEHYNYKFDTPTVWGWSPFKNLVYDQICQASYILDVTTQTISCSDLLGITTEPIDYSAKEYSLKVAIPSSPAMILPRVGLQHKNKKIYLDCAESWGALPPVFVYSPVEIVTITHNFYHGQITYSSEER